MAAVAAAIERVGVGVRHQRRAAGGGIGVVGIADQIDTALDLGRQRPEQRRVGGCGAGGSGSLEGRDRAGAAEIGMGVVDTGIDNGDFHALTLVLLRQLPSLGRANERHADGVVGRINAHRLDGHHAGQGAQRGDLVARDADLDAVQRALKVAQHHTALALDQRRDSGVVSPAGIDHRLTLGPAQCPADLGLNRRHGVTTQQHHHRDGCAVQAARHKALRHHIGRHLLKSGQWRGLHAATQPQRGRCGRQQRCVANWRFFHLILSFRRRPAWVEDASQRALIRG